MCLIVFIVNGTSAGDLCSPRALSVPRGALSVLSSALQLLAEKRLVFRGCMCLWKVMLFPCLSEQDSASSLHPRRLSRPRLQVFSGWVWSSRWPLLLGRHLCGLGWTRRMSGRAPSSLLLRGRPAAAGLTPGSTSLAWSSLQGPCQLCHRRHLQAGPASTGLFLGFLLQGRTGCLVCLVQHHGDYA